MLLIGLKCSRYHGLFSVMGTRLVTGRCCPHCNKQAIDKAHWAPGSATMTAIYSDLTLIFNPTGKLSKYLKSVFIL